MRRVYLSGINAPTRINTISSTIPAAFNIAVAPLAGNDGGRPVSAACAAASTRAPHAHQAFLGRAGHQTPLAIKDIAHREPART
jgi:hypothetical protein